MRDFLSLTPKRSPDLLHARGDAGGKPKKPKPKPKPEKREYRGSALEQKHRNELKAAFGANVFNLTAEEFIKSVPKKQRADVKQRLLNMLNRQVDEMIAWVDGVGHSDESETKDYLAFHKTEDGDALQYGVLGMKWGRRRSDAAIAADAATRAKAGEPITATKKLAEVTKAPSGPESSHDRYARIASVAKGGGAKGLSDDDLKFFNARTEAIKKVDKMFEEKPSWLRSTSEDVVRAVAKQQMQAVLAAVATKMISARVNEAMTQAQANAQKAAIKEGIKKGLEDAAKKAEMSKTSAKIPIGFGSPPKK